MAFKDLKSKSAKNIAAQLDKLKTNDFEAKKADYWYPETDKAGNGTAVIRFLPAPDGEDEAFVRIWSHSFKGPTTGQWYIENSRTTMGYEHKDPVAEMNSVFWNAGDKKGIEKRKRKLSYVSNVYIVKDPANPENEGQVKLFSYGKQIFDKIEAALKPEFEDDTAMNPFDLWEGANFRIRIKNEDGYRNYVSSSFEPQSALLGGDDEELEKVWKQCKSLQAVIDPSQFKSYDELKARLNKVLTPTEQSPFGAPVAVIESQEPATLKEMPAPAFVRQKTHAGHEPVVVEVDEDEDDDLKAFREMANSDD